MLNNLKLVLLQHKKFLAIFFIVIFLPSVILAIFGIRAIHNERYKLQHQNLEQQKGFVRIVKAGIQSLLERNLSSLKELSMSQAFFDRDHRAITTLISKRLQDESLIGQIVIWNLKGSLWLPGLQPRPPAAQTLAVPKEWIKWQLDLEKAQRAEFRRENFSEAISLYQQIFSRTKDKHVKAWMLLRMARCEIKQRKFKKASLVYRSIVTDFPDLLTESGRPLELTSLLGMLDALRSDKNYEDFFRESLKNL